MNRSPRLIETLPGRTLVELRRELREAREDGADWAEIRVDRLRAPDRPALSRLFPAPIPCLGTIRSSAEGGEGPTSPGARAEILESLLTLPLSGLDIELRRDLGFVRRHAGYWSGHARPRLLYSVHLSGRTPSNRIRDWIAAPLPARGERKIVVHSSVGRCVRELWPIAEQLSSSTVGLFSTGSSGALLRADAGRLRAPFVFCAPGSARQSLRVEEAQIPVDEMRSFVDGGADSLRFGLVGSPVSRSLSPQVFQSFFDATGRTGLYTLTEIAEREALRPTVRAMLSRGWCALNVTTPWKRTALRIADRAGPEARSSGCANLLRRSGSRVRADNTDVSAILRRLRELERRTGAPRPPVLVLGGGGAARATLAALQELGWEGELLARKRGVYDQLRREFRLGGNARRGGRPRVPELVVNATLAGSTARSTMPRDWLDRIGRSTSVMDWVVRPVGSPIERRARRAGARYEDGRRLLVYQAAEGFRLATGVPVPAATVRSTVESLCAE